jgi:hypothetical protein
MSEPTSSFSAYDIILRIAEAAGVAFYGTSGQERAYIPVNEDALQKCKRCLNDGIKMFMADAPPEGWRWRRRICEITFTTIQTTGTADAGTSATHLIDLSLASTYTTTNQINGYYAYITAGTGKGSYAVITAYNKTTGDCTVADWLTENGDPGGTDPTTGSSFSITGVQTVQGDKARYLLPQDCTGTTGPITYAAGSNRGSMISWAHETQIRKMRETTIQTGYPRSAAIRPYGSRRYELFIDPSPTTADTVIFPYEVEFNNLQLESGTAFNGSTTVLVTTDSHVWKCFPDDYFNGWTLHVVSGLGKNGYAVITDFDADDGTSAVFTVAKWLAVDGTSTNPSPGLNSIYYLEPVNNKHPSGAMFDECILSACLAKTQTYFDNISVDYMNKYLNKDLPKAWEKDIRTAPKKLATYRTTERIWNDIASSTISGSETTFT